MYRMYKIYLHANKNNKIIVKYQSEERKLLKKPNTAIGKRDFQHRFIKKNMSCCKSLYKCICKKTSISILFHKFLVK